MKVEMDRRSQTLVTAFMIMGAAILLPLILRPLGYSLLAMVEAIEFACQIANEGTKEFPSAPLDGFGPWVIIKFNPLLTSRIPATNFLLILR